MATRIMEWIDVEALAPRSLHAFDFAVVRLADGSWLTVPVKVAVGNRPRPRLVALAGVHGDELEGMLSLLDFWDTCDPGRLQGTVILLPVANPPAFAAHPRRSPLDGLDLNRTFPGKADGTPSERLAYRLLHEVIADGLSYRLHSNRRRHQAARPDDGGGARAQLHRTRPSHGGQLSGRPRPRRRIRLTRPVLLVPGEQQGGRVVKPSPLVSAPTRSCRLEQSQGLPVKRPDAEPDDDVHQGHDESHAPPRPQVHVAGARIDRGRAATVVAQGDAEIREERQAEGREIGWCPAAATATVRNGTNRAVTWAVRPAKK